MLVNAGFVRSMHYFFLGIVDLVIGRFIDTPVKALNSYGMIWTAGGLLLWSMATLIGNYGRQVEFPIFILVIVSTLLYFNMALPYYVGNSLVMLVQIVIIITSGIGVSARAEDVGYRILLGEFTGSAVVTTLFSVLYIGPHNLMAAVGFGMIAFVSVAMWCMLAGPVCAGLFACSLTTIPCEFLQATIDKTHWMFWASYFTLFPFLGYMGWFGFFGAIPVGVVALIPIVVKLSEVIRRCFDGYDELIVAKRRLLVARVFGTLVMMILQQMSVPLAQFYLDYIFQADIETYLVVLLTFLMIAIQFAGFTGLYYKAISDLINDRPDTSAEAANLPTAATSLLETYSYDYRYWIFIELFYDVLNSLFLNLSSHGNSELYWLNILLHAFYTYLHASQKPSMYPVHNWLNISVGASHLFEDIGVLESIYGNGALAQNGAWCLICAVAPIVISLARFIWEQCHSEEEESEEVAEDAARVKKLTEVENRTLTDIFYFLLYVTGAGVIFLHIAAICDWGRPTGWWIGQCFWVPICIIAVYVPVGMVIRFVFNDFAWDDLVAAGCTAAFCWWQPAQISPEGPS
jgi:hypothetical protein